MSSDPDNLVSRIAALDTAAADNRHRAESFQKMTEELRTVVGTASSPDGMVRVIAAPGGTVKNITFTAAVRETDPAALSAVVLHTLAAAHADAARRQAEVVRDALGDTELLDQVLSADEAIFGDQRPRDPGPAPVAAPIPAPAPRHRRAPEDDDEGGYVVMDQNPTW